MITTVTIENKEITVNVDEIGAIIATHVDGRPVDFKKDSPDGDFTLLYDREIVEAVLDEIKS